MTFQHKDLANGRWAKLSLVEQMANVGSEVERAIRWKNKGSKEDFRLAFHRALELLDLTLACRYDYPKLKEIARVREALVDYLAGPNQYRSTDESWQRYFFSFSYAIRRNR